MDYARINRESWDRRVGLHIDSAFYDMPAFRGGRSSLKPIEAERLGDLTGKSVLHLQCHFGQDTLSMARLGASVTGVDLSPRAIETARGLAEELQLEAEFICCNVLEADQHLTRNFEITQ